MFQPSEETMNIPHTRREFLADVGRGMLVATVGYGMANELGLAPAFAAEAPDTLDFGSLEPLVRFMQETPADKLLPGLAAKLKSGADLRRLVAAGALANARTFGGGDYIGFHTMMALSPAYHMSRELPAERHALPVFKVLYRNSSRIQDAHNGRRVDALAPVQPGELPPRRDGGDVLREQVRRADLAAAERTFAALCRGSAEDAFNHLLMSVQDHTDVHRVVLPYRAWDLMGVIGQEQAQTLLRQSVRYCVQAENWNKNGEWNVPRTLLPKLL